MSPALKVVIAASVSFLGLFAPAAAALAAALGLTVVDLVTGIVAAMRRKEPITSGKLRRTVVKLVVYELAILSAYTAQHWLTGDAFPLMSWAAGTIGLVELKSVLENLNSISGQDVLKSLIDKVTQTQTKPEPPTP